MSKSAILTSSIAKKYWMALTGLFLCTFLVGHLLGNLQLIFKVGEEGRRAFNEYAYFMQHNIFIKVLSYVTYISILFHAIDGLLLAFQNKKARPQKYAYNNPNANSSTVARQMALLGTIVLVFISTHMVNFWWKMKSEGGLPLHTINKTVSYPLGQNPQTGEMMEQTIEIKYALTTKGEYKEFAGINPQTGDEEVVLDVKDETFLYDKNSGLRVGEGYKDLHSAVMAFFGQSVEGVETNSMALVATILYVLAMLALSFHLWHGFASAFQSLGVNHKRYTPAIKIIGKAFSILVPLAFAIIPVWIYLSR